MCNVNKHLDMYVSLQNNKNNNKSNNNYNTNHRKWNSMKFDSAAWWPREFSQYETAQYTNYKK